MEMKELKRRILTANGTIKAQTVFKNARFLNVFTEQIEQGDIALCDGYIAGIGSYEGENEIDLQDAILIPGLMDGHIHIESTMMTPAQLQDALLVHGTTGIFADPHEIANVAGTTGLTYMLKKSRELVLPIYYMLPSCVPANPLDETGATLEAADLAPFLSHPRVRGLAELMDAYATTKASQPILDKIYAVKQAGKCIDGHAPGLSGKLLNAYVSASVQSDHECSSLEEALEKLALGQWIMIREGTAAHNLEALIDLCRAPYCHRCMFVTDDKHPGDLLYQGHIDEIVRRAVALGADPVTAIKMASYNPALYFKLEDVGAIAPGYLANFAVVDDLSSLQVLATYIRGQLVAKDGRPCLPTTSSSAPVGKLAALKEENDYAGVLHSFHMDPVEPAMLTVSHPGSKLRVIALTSGQLLTKEVITDWTCQADVAPGVDLSKDIIKMAVFERHHNTGHIGIGFVQGYGLKKGAIASSVAHDSHNLIVIGTNDEDIACAANTVREMEGGLAVIENGTILGSLALPIAGLMSPLSANEIHQQLEQLKQLAHSMGVSSQIDPFMTLAFTSLPVIPELRLNSRGLIRVEQQAIVDLTFEE